MTRLVEDKMLREAFRRGEQQAFAQVYREYARPLYAMLRQGFTFESKGRRVRFDGYADADEIESTVQEVFARVFQERSRLAYDGLRPFRNYLFTIARNLVADEYRRRGRQFVPLEASTEALDRRDVRSGLEQPDQELEAQQLNLHVRAFIDKLSSRERGIFDARVRDSLSVEATASLLGISEHRVKSTERRLRSRFFRTMRGHGYFEGVEPTGAWSSTTLLLCACWGGR